MRVLPTLMLLLVVGPCASAAPSADATAEIEHLFSYLHDSGCAFNRNGKWYDALQAVDHLRTKYAYLLKKGLVTSADSFVEQGASHSSMSGQAYLVRCGTASPVEASQWFMSELSRYRTSTQPTTKKPLHPAPMAAEAPASGAGERQL